MGTVIPSIIPYNCSQSNRFCGCGVVVVIDYRFKFYFLLALHSIQSESRFISLNLALKIGILDQIEVMKVKQREKAFTERIVLVLVQPL